METKDYDVQIQSLITKIKIQKIFCGHILLLHVWANGIILVVMRQILSDHECKGVQLNERKSI